MTARHPLTQPSQSREQPLCKDIDGLLQLKMSESTQTDYVTLVSNDGFEFKVRRSAACVADAIRKMLDPQCMLICTETNHNAYIQPQDKTDMNRRGVYRS